MLSYDTKLNRMLLTSAFTIAEITVSYRISDYLLKAT